MNIEYRPGLALATNHPGMGAIGACKKLPDFESRQDQVRRADRKRRLKALRDGENGETNHHEDFFISASY